jgi:hypothetical protein
MTMSGKFEVLFHIKGDKAKIINFRNIPTERELVQRYGVEAVSEYDNQQPFCYRYPKDSRSPLPSLYIERDRYSSFHYYIWQEITLDRMKEIEELLPKAYENYCRVFGIDKEKQETVR